MQICQTYIVKEINIHFFVDLVCPPGFYFTFHVHNARACRNCFSGFYSANFTRPNERCIACPIYQITAQRASTSITQCKDIDRGKKYLNNTVFSQTVCFIFMKSE